MIIKPTPQAIDDVVAHLKAGELAAIPTETVYGLAADASQPQAVAKIYALKKRPMNNPLIVHLASAEHLSQWASHVPESAKILAKAFWPGPLTLILPKAACVPEIVTAGQDSVGVRVPAHPVALAILEKFQGGLAAPSANPFTQISPTTAAHVTSQFDDSLWIVDGGPTNVGLESTIIDCTQQNLIMLRQGMITAQEILMKTGLLVTAKHQNATTLHPGQALRHYSPRTPLKLFTSDQLAEALQIDTLAKIGIIYFSELDIPQSVFAIQLPNDAKSYARLLYAALHDLDNATCDEIWVEIPPYEGAWLAIHERLGKAAAQNNH